MNYYHHHVNDNGEESFFGAISDDGRIIFRTDDPTEYAAAKIAYSSTDNEEDAKKLYDKLIDRYLSGGDGDTEEEKEEKKEVKICEGDCAACSCHDHAEECEDEDADEGDEDLDDDWDDEDECDLPAIKGFIVELSPWELLAAAAAGFGAFSMLRRLFRR